MDRMSMLEAEFLHLEDQNMQLHIGACAVFEGPAPDFAEFAAMTESKLPRVPRFRHIIREVPFGMGRPVWIDDPHFLLDYHLRHTALPAPGGRDELQRLMSRVMAQRLDRARPLWESWMVDGLADDRWAVISKVHHSMVDGVSGTEMMNILFDLEPDAPLADGESWEPRGGPSDVDVAIDAVGGFLSQAFDTAVSLGSALVRPTRLVADLRNDRDAARTFAQPWEGDQTSALHGRIGPHRRWSWTEADLDDVKSVKEELGGTVNDVVLAAIAAGFRTLLVSRGDPVDSLTLRTFVPVSVRGPDEHDELNNKVSGLIAELPIGLDDPVARLRSLTEQMSELKASHEADAGEALGSLGDLVFPGLLAVGTRFALRVAEHLPDLSVGTVTTNVPGPQFPLYALGRELVGYYPYVPIGHGLPAAIAILSYNGRVAFGVTGDHDALPDIEVLTRGIRDGLDELVGTVAKKTPQV